MKYICTFKDNLLFILALNIKCAIAKVASFSAI